MTTEAGSSSTVFTIKLAFLFSPTLPGLADRRPGLEDLDTLLVMETSSGSSLSSAATTVMLTEQGTVVVSPDVGDTVDFGDTWDNGDIGYTLGDRGDVTDVGDK